MGDRDKINSSPYWDGRFSEDWETSQGPSQSRFFSKIAIDHCPNWLVEQIRRNSLSFADWGCAQGDGTDVWGSFVGTKQLFGIDFSSVAIQQALKRYPAIRFFSENWLEDDNNGSKKYNAFDVVFSSNTLEHFTQPFDVLNLISKHASKAIILALPYKELDRIDEHFFSFIPENIPLRLENGFRLVWSRVVDCRKIQNTFWMGDQIILVYADMEWFDSLKLTLSECNIETLDFRYHQNATADPIDGGNLAVPKVAQEQSDANAIKLICSLDECKEKILTLESTLFVRDSEIKVLTSELEERDAQIVNLDSHILEKEIKIRNLTKNLDESTAKVVALTNDSIKYDVEITELQAEIAGAHEQLALLDAAVLARDEQIKTITSSRSWKLTRPARLANRLVGAIGSKDQQYALLKSVYWNLPEFLRGKLNKHRHAYVAKNLYHNDATLVTTQQLSKNVIVQVSEWVAKANKSQRVAIVPCGFEFDELVNQRPINAAKYFSGKGYLVLFVAWQWTPADILSKGCAEVWPNVYQVPLFEFISMNSTFGNNGDSSIFLVTMPAPSLVNLIPSLRQRGFNIVYDVMDEWEAFSHVGQAPWFKKAVEQSLVLQSDFVCTVAPALRDKFSNLRNDIQVIGNGYSPDVIGTSNKNMSRSHQQEEIIIGYFGHLTDAWFDWRLLFYLAKKRKDVTFELIGYGEPDWVRTEAVKYSNMRLIGKVLPKDLHIYASRWSAGIIPFVTGTLAESVDPIKIYEYLYFGLPTVVTGIRHLKEYPMTFYAEREDIILVFDRAIKVEWDEKAVDQFLEETTWSARFDLLVTLATKYQNIRRLYEK